MKINEWIWIDIRNDWVSHIKQDSLNYYTDTFEPWQTKQRLKIWREVEWSDWNSKTLYFTFTAWTALWVQSYTGFWFTPTWYIIKAWLLDTASGFCASECFRFWTTQWGWLSYTWTYSNTTTRVLAVYNSAWTLNTRANHSAFLSDWISLDFINNSNNVWLLITAFK